MLQDQHPMTFFPSKTRYRLLEKGEAPPKIVAKYRLYRGTRLAGMGLPLVMHDESGRYICRSWIDTFLSPPKLVREVYEVYRLGSDREG